MLVIWAPLALRQVARIHDYLVALNPSAARHVAEELVAAADSLVNFAHRGRPVQNTDMRELISTYPYIIRYRIARDDVRILRVRHTARQPTKP